MHHGRATGGKTPLVVEISSEAFAVYLDITHYNQVNYGDHVDM